MPDDAFGRLARFAAHHAPYYADQEWARRVRAGGEVVRTEVPILSKAHIMESGDALKADTVATGHEQTYDDHTSGSTGTPLTVLKSRLQKKMQRQEDLRLKESWRLDEYTIHLYMDMRTTEHPMGEFVRRTHGNLELYSLYSQDTQLLADTVRKTRAEVVHTWPSGVRGLMEVIRKEGGGDSIRLITTRSEMVTPDLRALADEVASCRILDLYGNQETGTLAAECAKCGSYHTARGSALVESVREDGLPAGPGQSGRIIVTALHSYAMPLLRYDTGDIAVTAEPGECQWNRDVKPGAGASSGGRLSFERIEGRWKDLFVAPNGNRFAPLMSAERIARFPLRQYKLVQTGRDTVEVIYVTRTGSTVDERALADVVTADLPAGFVVTCRAAAEIPAAASGKYIMHECLYQPGD